MFPIQSTPGEHPLGVSTGVDRSSNTHPHVQYTYPFMPMFCISLKVSILKPENGCLDLPGGALSTKPVPAFPTLSISSGSKNPFLLTNRTM